MDLVNREAFNLCLYNNEVDITVLTDLNKINAISCRHVEKGVIEQQGDTIIINPAISNVEENSGGVPQNQLSIYSTIVGGTQSFLYESVDRNYARL